MSDCLQPMDCSTPGSSVLYYLLNFAQIHAHWASDAIKPSHPLPPPSPFAFNLSQHQGLFQWVSSSHQVAKILRALVLATVSSVQSLSSVWLFASPWTSARQASLSFAISWSLLRLMSNHLILCRALLLLPSIFPTSGSFPVNWLFESGGQSTGASASQ